MIETCKRCHRAKYGIAILAGTALPIAKIGTREQEFFLLPFSRIGGVTMNSVFNVGIDIGSTTIKLVVMDKERQIVYKSYARHFSEIGNALHENLAALR